MSLILQLSCATKSPKLQKKKVKNSCAGGTNFYQTTKMLLFISPKLLKFYCCIIKKWDYGNHIKSMWIGYACDQTILLCFR